MEGRGTPIVMQLLGDNPPVFWNPTAASPAEYRDVAEPNTTMTYEIDLASDKMAYGALVKFNTWTSDDSYEGSNTLSSATISF